MLQRKEADSDRVREAYQITELLHFHLVGEHSDQSPSDPAPGDAHKPQPRAEAAPGQRGQPPLALHEPELVDLHPAVRRGLDGCVRQFQFDQVFATNFVLNF